MSYRVRFTLDAKADIERLYQFLAGQDTKAAGKALEHIGQAMQLLEDFPFTCRQASAGNPLLRELIISFGQSGYVALFEIEDASTVTVLAMRHQREDDYYQ